MKKFYYFCCLISVLIKRQLLTQTGSVSVLTFINDTCLIWPICSYLWSKTALSGRIQSDWI